MQAFVLPFLPGVVSFALFLVLLPFAMRVPWPSSPALRSLPVAVIAFAAGVVIGWRWFGVVMPWHSAAAFGLLFMLVWFAFGTIAKSVTLLLTCRMLDFPQGAPAADMKRDVIEREFDVRAELLCAMGYAVAAEGRYSITPAGQAFLRKLTLASRLLGVTSAGLYGLGK